MKIDVKTLEKLVWIIYKRFFIEKGKLKDIQIKIDQYIQIRMVLVYKGIETKNKKIGKRKCRVARRIGKGKKNI